MKLRTFFMAVMAGAALLVGCNKEVDFGPAKVALDQTNLAFEEAGGSQAVSLTATRDWAVNGVPEWVAVSATNGQAAVEAQPLKITVTQNAAYDRSATLVFTIGFARTSLIINQAGPNGQVDNGDGTLENPYNVTGVIEYLNELGADVNSPKKVFVKGKVSALASKESDQFGGTGNTFGNGSFTMSDDGSVNGGQFTAYRINYLGNKKFAAGDTPVKVGDEVIVYGNVVNYKGNTPETQQNQAFLYSLNGENRGGVDAGSGEDGEEVPDENLEPAGENNIAGLVAKIDKAATQSAPTAIADFALTSATVTYVNGSSAYIEDKSGAVLLYKSGHGLKAGDVLSGTLSTSGYYRYGVPQLTSLDGITPTAGEAPDPTEMTIEYLLSTYSSQLSRFLIIKDITVSTGMSGRNAVISQGDKSVNVYAGLSSGLNLAQDATGDIIVFPTLYNTTKQVTFWDNSHFTGEGGEEPGGDEPSDEYANAPAKTVEEFIQLADKENYYKLTGTVSKFNPTYCSFDLTDASGTIYVYSVLAAYKTDEWKNKIKDGGTITIAGKYDYYASKSQHEVINAALLSFTDAEGGDEPGTDEPSLPVNDGLTEATAFTVQDAIYMAKNGTEDKEYFVKAVVGKDISIKNGTASFELVDGTTDGKLTVVKAKSFGGEDFANDAPIEWLDEVILKGKVTEYSTLPALVNGQLVKWNGLPVFEAQFKTIAELNALCTATATEYVGTLENAVVSFVPSTSNAIIKDATGSILLYKKDHGLKQGQTYSGLVTVTALMYNGNYTELTAIDATFAGEEAAIEPQVLTLSTLAEEGSYAKWQNAYVTIKNMEVTAVDKKNVSVKGSDWIMFSNAGNATCAVGDMITVTGTVTKFGETLEIKAWTMDAIVKAEPAFSTVAELNAACTATAQELVGKLTDAVVSFAPDNKNAVIKDATGSILLYKTNHGLKQGQTFSGWTTVKAVLYNNAGELTAMDAAFTGDEAAVEPEALSLATLAADFAKYQNAYVVVENLEVTAVSGKNISVKDGETSYVVFSSAGNATCKVGAVIKATGTVAQYNGNGQIKAWSLDAIEVTKEAPEEEAPTTAITLSFTSITNKVTGYTDSWVQTCGDYSWTLANFNNNSGGWTYVRCGRKNNESVATITTDAAFTQAIQNVVVTYDTYNAEKVNSTKLYVASDAEFTQDVQTVSGSVAGAGAYTYTITTPTANMYYKLEVDCASHSANGFVQISKVVYNY